MSDVRCLKNNVDKNKTEKKKRNIMAWPAFFWFQNILRKQPAYFTLKGYTVQSRVG
jgi:hypothetical protein